MSAALNAPVRVLGAATILGLLGILLFHDAAWGANIFFWVLALGGGAIGLSRWLSVPIPKAAQYAAPVILVFAACYGFREAPELKFANGVALFLLIGALLVRTRSGTHAQASFSDLTLKAVGAWFKLTSDFAKLVVRDVKWTGSEKHRDRIRAVVRGVAIAAPLLLLFGCLFASADDAFRGVISRAFAFDWLNGQALFQAAIIFLFCAVMSAGIYRVILMEKKAEVPTVLLAPSTNPMKLGMTEIAVIFGLLNALFALFVVIQAEYLFGGMHHLKLVEGLTYTEYARHGFFELSIVSAGALVTILGFHSLMREPERNQRSFSILAGILTAFVAVILVSAFQRMNLYIQFAGLTELRIYTTAFMIWIGAVLVWLAATVLRGRQGKFAAGAMAAGLAAIFALNVINPDATIAQYNLGLPGHRIDVSYLESLSVDAAPAVLNGTSHLPSKEAADLRLGLRKRWSQEVDTDWRGLNFARWKYLNVYRSEL